jgi:GDP-4-dehydro-6-deoxy-D-mannose reductase
VNTTGAVRLLTELAVRRAAGALDPVVLVVGTGMQYGRHDPSEMPLSEGAELRPTTPYAASKAAQEVAALQIARASGLRVMCTRSFNHSGVGHGQEYLLPSLVRRVNALRHQPGVHRLALGNDVVRDYLHVRDVVNAYLLLLDTGVGGDVYNVASGRGISVRALATEVLLRAGVEAEITTDKSLVRPLDIPALTGAPDRLIAATGWSATRTCGDIIDDLLNAPSH